jgi:hypothetical protein
MSEDPSLVIQRTVLEAWVDGPTCLAAIVVLGAVLVILGFGRTRREAGGVFGLLLLLLAVSYVGTAAVTAAVMRFAGSGVVSWIRETGHVPLMPLGLSLLALVTSGLVGACGVWYLHRRRAGAQVLQ